MKKNYFLKAFAGALFAQASYGAGLDLSGGNKNYYIPVTFAVESYFYKQHKGDDSSSTYGNNYLYLSGAFIRPYDDVGFSVRGDITNSHDSMALYERHLVDERNTYRAFVSFDYYDYGELRAGKTNGFASEKEHNNLYQVPSKIGLSREHVNHGKFNTDTANVAYKYWLPDSSYIGDYSSWSVGYRGYAFDQNVFFGGNYIPILYMDINDQGPVAGSKYMERVGAADAFIGYYGQGSSFYYALSAMARIYLNKHDDFSPKNEHGLSAVLGYWGFTLRASGKLGGLNSSSAANVGNEHLAGEYTSTIFETSLSYSIFGHVVEFSYQQSSLDKDVGDFRQESDVLIANIIYVIKGLPIRMSVEAFAYGGHITDVDVGKYYNSGLGGGINLYF